MRSTQKHVETTEKDAAKTFEIGNVFSGIVRPEKNTYGVSPDFFWTDAKEDNAKHALNVSLCFVVTTGFPSSWAVQRVGAPLGHDDSHHTST